MSTSELERKVRELIKNPEYKRILENAVRIERNPPNDEVKELGWEWHDVGAHPGRLTKLVSEGVVKVSYKSRRFTNYRLVDLDLIERVLKESAK